MLFSVISVRTFLLTSLILSVRFGVAVFVVSGNSSERTVRE